MSVFGDFQVRIFTHSNWIQENTEQKISNYGHFCDRHFFWDSKFHWKKCLSSLENYVIQQSQFSQPQFTTGLFKRNIFVFHKFYLVHSWILRPIYTYLDVRHRPVFFKVTSLDANIFGVETRPFQQKNRYLSETTEEPQGISFAPILSKRESPEKSPDKKGNNNIDNAIVVKLVWYSKTLQTRHEKWSFPLKISSVNVTKSADSCWFGHIYWRNP